MATEKQLPPACAFAISVLNEYQTAPDDVPEEAVEAARQHISTCIRCLSDTTIQDPAPRNKKKAAGIGNSASINQSVAAPSRTSVVKENRRTPRNQVTAPPPAPAIKLTPTIQTPIERVAISQTTILEETTERLKPITRARPEPQITSTKVPEPSITPPPVKKVLEPVQKINTVQEPAQVAKKVQEPASINKEPIKEQTAVQPVKKEEMLSPVTEGSLLLDCQQCRELLPDYVEALETGQNVALLYPDVQQHLLTCESGCLVLLGIFQQEAKANRKFRRKPVRNPFGVIWWEISGFFRSGQVPISPKALAYGTLMLLVLFALLGGYAGFNIDEARRYQPPAKLIPTPDGVGFSDGLKIYDACNGSGYEAKRQAAQALQQHKAEQADALLKKASGIVDTTGCNSAEAAIYREDLQVRRSERPFSTMIVSFDSGPGNANPEGGTDRHILYAAASQQLVGSYIAQQQYNEGQMKTAGAPLLYLILANTTGDQQGALQIANRVAELKQSKDLKPLGLLATGQPPILGILGLGPSNLTQVVLPVLCRAGLPLIEPSSTGRFIIDLVTQTSLYRHCTPGFAFVRFSPDDAHQSGLAADYAYTSLRARNVAVLYDPSNPSSSGSAQGFTGTFGGFKGTKIVAQETAVASGLLDSDGRPQASTQDLKAGLNDALAAKPDVIFAPLLSNDITVLAQEIAKLPVGQQPILMIGGEFVRPSALQGLVPWARQQQLTPPRVFISVTSAATPPTEGDWQKQFYASFCTSFASPGSYCSGAGALDQGALLFGDGVRLMTGAVGPGTTIDQIPMGGSLVQKISQQDFAGVSGPIALRLDNDVLVTSTKTKPVILALQPDGNLQIVS